MRVLMVTNTYRPIINGLQRSIDSSSRSLRRKGHRVLVLAPGYGDAVPEPGVLRVPSLRRIW